MNLPTGKPSHLSRFITQVVIIAASFLGSASTLFAQDRLFAIVSTQTAGSVVPRHSLMAINWVGRRLPSEEVRVVVP